MPYGDLPCVGQGAGEVSSSPDLPQVGGWVGYQLRRQVVSSDLGEVLSDSATAPWRLYLCVCV